MVWDVPDYLWERNYAAAVEYLRLHGNLEIPAAYITPEGILPGRWIRKLAPEALTDERRALPEAIGGV